MRKGWGSGCHLVRALPSYKTANLETFQNHVYLHSPIPYWGQSRGDKGRQQTCLQASRRSLLLGLVMDFLSCM